MKGAWTYVPNAKFVLSVHERLSASCQLLDEVCEASCSMDDPLTLRRLTHVSWRLTSEPSSTVSTYLIDGHDEYRCFTSAMKTVYFLQLVLTLTAIASRLYALVREIRSSVDETRQLLHRLVTVLDVCLRLSLAAQHPTHQWN
jgi:hypothetical protein